MFVINLLVPKLSFHESISELRNIHLINSLFLKYLQDKNLKKVII